jgi:hypothetical protein
MTKKFQTLLNINAIMKQRVEKQFAELVKQGEFIRRAIKKIEGDIQSQYLNVSTQAQRDPFSIQIFSEWENAQKRKIKKLRQEELSMKEKQAPLRKELASLFVKEKMLLIRLQDEQREQTLKVQKDRAEKTQAVWLQNNYN